MKSTLSLGGEVRFTKVSRKPSMWWRIHNFPNYWRGAWRAQVAHMLGVPHFVGTLRLQVRHTNGTITDYGIVSKRVITTAGVGFIVDAFQNLEELENMKFHGFGTGAGAEAVGDTALATELTTEYAVDNTRPTGTTAEGASANIYQTVATLTPDASVALTEHGIFDQASNAGGVLLDRSLFAVVNLSAAESVIATYEMTLNAGG